MALQLEKRSTETRSYQSIKEINRFTTKKSLKILILHSFFIEHKTKKIICEYYKPVAPIRWKTTYVIVIHQVHFSRTHQ